MNRMSKMSHTIKDSVLIILPVTRYIDYRSTDRLWESKSKLMSMFMSRNKSNDGQDDIGKPHNNSTNQALLLDAFVAYSSAFATSAT